MASKFFPMLPKLKNDSAVTPDKTSVWENKEYNFLNELIKSIAVSGSIADINTIDSIPDVWARPLLFEMALFDKEGAEQQFVAGFHERVVGEWRSIMTMLALNDVKHLNLHVKEVRLNETNGSIDRILSELKPQEKNISEDTNWDVLYILLYKDIPIAMTSPLTLVSAAADYTTSFNGTIPKPWSNDGRYLVDPIPYLTQDEKRALLAWLIKLDKNINEHVTTNRDNERFLNILDIIRTFAKDVQNVCSEDGTAFDFKNGMLKMHAGIFKFLDSAIKAKAATAQDSAVRLLASNTRKPKEDVLLISPKMLSRFANEYNLSPTKVIVWPGLTANDITEQDLRNGNNTIGNVKLNNALFFSPDSFFTKHMAVMEPGTALKGTIKIRGEELLANDDLSAILPIRKELLEYFTPEDIADRLTIEDDGDNYLIHFAFPLSGVDGNGHDFDFVKAYPKKDLIYLQTTVPVIEIWPNIRRANWHRYYLYYENSEATNNKKELGKDFFYVLPWAYNKNLVDDVPEKGLANQYTTRMNDYPEALLCTVNTSLQGNIRTQTIETGLILLDKPTLVEEDGLSKWQIGIDFGTSSTMIYYRDNNLPPKPLDFQSHLFQVTNSGVLRNNTYIRFIPSTNAQADGSFLSIFHLLNTKKSHTEIKPLQDGHIFPLTSERSAEFTNQVNRIDTNLKWQANDTGRFKSTAYLEQICMQAIVEAAIHQVAELQWKFSYPAAFSDEERESFRKICIKAIQEACDDTCFKPNIEEFDTELESVATALHFNKLDSKDTNFAFGAVCLDIGAGTTDISIISGQPGKIVYHTSILFAGRYLFEPIYQYVEHNCLSKKEKEALQKVLGPQRTAIIDANMREHSDEYLRNLANLTGNDEIKAMLEKTQFALAGILYYVGGILKYLHEQGIYVEDHVPNIYVGGNGSRAFYWITGGGFYDRKSIRLNALKQTIIDASGFEDNYNFNIFLSKQPKVEVASGMLEDAPKQPIFNETQMQHNIFGETDDEYILQSVLPGTDFKVNNEAKTKNDFLSARDIAAGITVDNFEELDEFVKVFNSNRKSIWLNGIKLNDSQKSAVKERVNSHYISEKGTSIKEIHVEPIFITTLKKLMEMLDNGRQ